MSKLKLIEKVKGGRYVNFAHVVFRASGCAIIEIDMHLKRAEVLTHTSGTIRGSEYISPPELCFANTDESYFLGKLISKASGIISFPMFLGWEIYMVSSDKNTIKVAIERNGYE